MKQTYTLLRVGIVACILLVLLVYGAYYFLLSPSAVLKNALHISKIPNSVRNLRMGSDVWIHEVDSFYFTISPGDFHELLTGRQFQTVVFPVLHKARTIHLSPAETLTGHSSYKWETNGADCTIFADDSHEHVIVWFSAD